MFCLSACAVLPDGVLLSIDLDLCFCLLKLSPWMYFISVLFTVLSQLMMLTSPPVNHCTLSALFALFLLFLCGLASADKSQLLQPQPTFYSPRVTQFMSHTFFFFFQSDAFLVSVRFWDSDVDFTQLINLYFVMFSCLKAFSVIDDVFCSVGILIFCFYHIMPYWNALGLDVIKCFTSELTNISTISGCANIFNMNQLFCIKMWKWVPIFKSSS